MIDWDCTSAPVPSAQSDTRQGTVHGKNGTAGTIAEFDLRPPGPKNRRDAKSETFQGIQNVHTALNRKSNVE